MTYFTKVFTVALMAILIASTAIGQGNLTDPYDILNRHFEANGGLDRLKAERTQYMEGSLSVAGLQGTLKVWIQKPDRSRIEADLGIFKMTQGDNGEYQWVLDSNGKLQLITNPDEATVKRKEVNRRKAEYEYADSHSDVFNISFGGIETIEGKDCYVIKVKNNINSDTFTSYINVENFFLEKSVSIEAENSNDTFYRDYQDVDGLMVAFCTKQIAHQTGQEEEVLITEYISNPEIDPALFDAPQETGKDYGFVEGSSAENIPIRFTGNHLYIPVTVACRERFWILDTGAALSVISEEFAGELGLEMQGSIKGMGAGGTVDVSLTTLPPFSLKGIQFAEQNVAVIDMKDLNRMLDVEVAGILGYDFLSRFVTRIDYANELVSFYDTETFEYTGSGHEVDVHIKNNVFMVEGTLDDEHSGTWLFDLGASTTSLHGAYALRSRITERKGVEGLGRGAGNTFRSKKVKCKKIEFAGFTVENPMVSFSYGGTDTIFTADEIGTLGNTLFRNFTIYCDYANERVIVEKGDDFGREFPEDRSGLQLFRGGDGELEVLFVARGTPAAKAGFQEGDVVRVINGIDARYLGGLISVRGMLKEAPGTKYTIIVDRDGREKKMKLKLADLF